jgi:hypothetical protein
MANPLRYSDPLGLKSFPFGSGKFCRDTDCPCVNPPIEVLGEDSAAFVPPPERGQCVDADAVYGRKCVLKIPDNFKCTLKCDPSAPSGDKGRLECRPKLIFGGIGLYVARRKPECFDDPKEIPLGWPPNPFAAGEP